MKIFGFYSTEKSFDRAWYDSSNILYSECDDKTDSLKTVRIAFKSGAMYEYYDVNVGDYLQFREAASQGKAFSERIKNKGYEYKKLDNADKDGLLNELGFRSRGGVYIDTRESKLTVLNNCDEVIYKTETEASEETVEALTTVLEALGHEVKKLD